MCPQMTGTSQQNTKTPQVHIPAASAAGNTSVSVTLDPQAQLESDKRAVYRLVQSPMRSSCVMTRFVRVSCELCTNLKSFQDQKYTVNIEHWPQSTSGESPFYCATILFIALPFVKFMWQFVKLVSACGPFCPWISLHFFFLWNNYCIFSPASCWLYEIMMCCLLMKARHTGVVFICPLKVAMTLNLVLEGCLLQFSLSVICKPKSTTSKCFHSSKATRSTLNFLLFEFDKLTLK